MPRVQGSSTGAMGAGPVSGFAEAGVAATRHLYFDVPSAERARQHAVASGRDRQIGQARDGAADATHEMRCMICMTVIACHLEAPRMIPQLRAAQQARLRQVHQVSIERASIPGVLGQGLYDFGVAHGPVSFVENSQYCDPRGGGPETHTSDLGKETVTPRVGFAGLGCVHRGTIRNYNSFA